MGHPKAVPRVGGVDDLGKGEIGTAVLGQALKEPLGADDAGVNVVVLGLDIRHQRRACNGGRDPCRRDLQPGKKVSCLGSRREP